MFFGLTPLRSTRRESNFFSRPKADTQASIQPIGNPVYDSPESQQSALTARFQALLNDMQQRQSQARSAMQQKRDIQRDIQRDTQKAEENLKELREREAKAEQMRKAYSSFLGGLD